MSLNLLPSFSIGEDRLDKAGTVCPRSTAAKESFILLKESQTDIGMMISVGKIMMGVFGTQGEISGIFHDHLSLITHA